jgi:transmembrane sensor
MKDEFKYQSINQRISQSIRYYKVPSPIEKNAALNSLLEKIHTSEKEETRTVIFPVWAKSSLAVAASLILAIILWVVFASQNITNQGNQVVSFRLPDHSRVVLSAQSTVTYNRLFLNRNLQLKGKAYFEVKKGKKFSVSTSKGNVEVLGTRFTVDSRKDRLQVICFDGKVKASFQTKNSILLPGSGVLFADRKEQVNFTEEQKYPGFARYHAKYENTGLDVILNDLEAFFGVKIENQNGKKRYFTGSIDTGSLDVALAILTGSLKLNYKLENESVIRLY